MSRDLLKEAIADAKAVKETAIANAKAYLEEAFTPQLRTMLATKLEELEDEGDMRDDGGKNKETEKTEDEKYGHDLAESGLRGAGSEIEDDERGQYGHYQESKDEEEVDENLDLDSILKELSEAEAGADEFEVTGVEVKDEESETVDVDVDEEEEEEFNIEELSEDDLKDFISGVIDDMVEAGEIEAGEGVEDEEEVEVEDETEVEEIDENVPVGDPYHQGYDDREDESISDRHGPLRDKDVSAKGRRDDAYGKWGKRGKEDRHGQHIHRESLNYQKGYTSGRKVVTNKLNEAYRVIKALKGELNEINLLNAKLLYTNKIFRSKTLTESQKVKVLSAFDKTNSVKEVKLVFETLSENLKAKKSNIRESMGFASKATGGTKRTRKPIIETDPMVARFQKLAGI